jgi:hypothetical protein
MVTSRVDVRNGSARIPIHIAEPTPYVRKITDDIAYACDPRGSSDRFERPTEHLSEVGARLDYGGQGFGVAEDKGADHHSAAELLGDWRAAERDTAAAKTAATIAGLALKTAKAAEQAAAESEAAAKSALEAAERANVAADRAINAASQAAEAAHLLSATAQVDKAEANHAVDEAVEAETAAHNRYHDAASEGFPKA